MLGVGAPAPAGYTFIGTFELSAAEGVRPRTVIKVDIYRKN